MMSNMDQVKGKKGEKILIRELPDGNVSDTGGGSNDLPPE